ncbi:MAG: integral membrane protein MviN [uncultured bacterium]|nr:MAG: integral membrane protein MviN [uncultured bacterium]KKP68707.1 MAG: Integral membrane protein MviN [Candidatus Moranbacteria bacterium GW2011_GWE1_35_17]KKP69293.1 MAG: Integral membrane protein MviN [Candidatus Moranbacteria bacterium GW2011_GWE2_35_164]KKP81394.1 MAG: Integral membrane protein MviN [Candidatus Moranbacteria bacterium GW2011_GWF1_35_5]KKP84780.1 MAG: Integral membrane protein MviN [Candidatus Moranbacteria bacterium GW2011_GWF2_35_54]HBR79213.1 murein biosynthesis in
MCKLFCYSASNTLIQKIINNKVINGKPTKTIAGAALIVSVAGILSRILGLFRDRILASKFGAGDELDVYYAAFRVPDLIYNFLIVGALSAAFIPVFTGLVAKKDKDKSWDLASGLLTLQVSIVVIISVVFFLFAPELTKLITPGFPEEKIMHTAALTRIMFLSPLFLGISAIFGGILVSYKRFLIYSIAPIFYNVGIIIGAVFFVEFWGVAGLAWGVVLGALMHFALQFFAVKFVGFTYQFRNIKKIIEDTNIRKVIRLMIPRSMAMGVSQINLLIVTIFASTLASGSLAVFNFANNLQSVPLGIFGISFSIAAFPRLSALAAKDNMEKFNYVFSRTFKRILFFVIPSSLIIFSLRAEIVRAVLGAGEFDWEDTTATLWVLGFLSFSLFAQSTIPLLTRCFYALENTKTPFYAALFSESINILLVMVLIEKFQILGLAIAFSVASIINMATLFFLLDKKFKDTKKSAMLTPIVKILIASSFLVMAIYLTRHALANFIQLKTLGEVLAQLIIAGGMGVSIFLIACYWLGVEEFNDFRKTTMKCICGKPKDLEDKN